MNHAEAQFIGLMKYSPISQNCIRNFFSNISYTETWMNDDVFGAHDQMVELDTFPNMFNPESFGA